MNVISFTRWTKKERIDEQITSEDTKRASSYADDALLNRLAR